MDEDVARLIKRIALELSHILYDGDTLTSEQSSYIEVARESLEASCHCK
ncbi:hypothetical protein [Listeria booriae]|nr:hypothetical protein [Listeria booriae]MBC1358305.1 hypothetical protein [Listeria booriae]